MSLFLLLCTINAYSQLSEAFLTAAQKATKTYNNKNEKCVQYLKALNKFLVAKAETFDIKSYKHYKISTKVSNANIFHDDFPSSAISTNGVHYITIIDGYVFDNHHPQGQLEADFYKKLFCPAGGVKPFPIGFNDKSVVEDAQKVK